MPSYERHIRIRRSAAEVFDFVGVNGYRNNPRWENEVLSWSEVTPLPVRAGTTAVMHRQDGNKRRDVHLRCTEYVPGKYVAWQHTDPGPFQFFISFDALPLGATETDLVVRTVITLSGPLRLMSLLFKRQQVKTGERLGDEVKRLLEEPDAMAGAASTA
jgi:hypothetical protein